MQISIQGRTKKRTVALKVYSELVYKVAIDSAKTGNSTKLELHHMASLKLVFLWTSILLKTA